MVSSGTATRQHLTPREHLIMERASPIRHQFFRGEVFAMAGASRRHNLIVTNIVGALWSALRDRPCEVYPSDMRVKVEATGSYAYPGVTLVCGPPSLEDEHGDTLLNPLLLFEVLSDSTESFDRGEKFEHYRAIPSLAEVVFVSQKQAHVEHFERQADGSWPLREYRAGQRLVLPAPGCEVAVDDLYLKVFPTPADGGPGSHHEPKDFADALEAEDISSLKR
jgi:Uma2 family endonuclease